MSFRSAAVHFIIALLITSFESQGARSSFCGSIDFQTITNDELERVVFLEHLSRGIRSRGCGLPGEQLSICSSCADEVSEEMMRVIRPVMGSKAHSDWHSRWHKIRSNAAGITDSLFGKLQQQGQVPANISRQEFFEEYGQRGSKAGENFFFMHRMMIKMVQFELSMSGLPCISPWTHLPSSVLDRSWPVPKVYADDAEIHADQRNLNRLKSKLNRYLDSHFLKKITLNDLGLLLESDLHQDLHQFYRGNPFNSAEALSQGIRDDLLPVESSAANKYFWKIHGLVDEILGHWLRANGFQTISGECGDDPSCYPWSATWVGRYPQM